MHWGDGWDSWWWMPLGMLLFWIVVVVAIVLIVRAFAAPRSARTPDAVLDDRYARGEIDDEEYRRRRATMREHRGG